MKRISCCYGCEPPKRYLGCHSKCKEYIAEKAEWDAAREKIKAERWREAELDKYDITKAEKCKKKYGR